MKKKFTRTLVVQPLNKLFCGCPYRVATFAVVVLVGRNHVGEVEQALPAPDVAVVGAAHTHRARVEVDVPAHNKQFNQILSYTLFFLF